MKNISYILASLGTIACSQTKFSTQPVTQTNQPKAAAAESVSPTPTPQTTATSTASPTPLSTVVPAYGTCSAPCSGTTRTFKNAKYNKWVKVVLCSSQRYDILMSESESGPFHKVGDSGGHGQDHCELVNPNFADLRSDDDVTSGNCPSCAVQSAGSVTNIPDIYGKKIYLRSRWGQPFELVDATAITTHTSCWYECGVSFP
jgi:hypothetical protein